MYIAYFVNINTGELKISRKEMDDPSPFSYPDYNVHGWSKVSENLFILFQLSYNRGFVAGVKDA